jgi:DNA-binding response OmpR family regulator
MQALLVTADLVFASKFAAAVQRASVTGDTALDREALESKLSAGSPKLVVLDLSTPWLEVPAVMERLNSLGESKPTVLAFGAHVKIDALDAARIAGCDVVIPRGQFNAQMDELLKRFAL